jgi:hemerythrin superfamily protein
MPITKTRATDAIELLTTDHENVRRLLAQLEETTARAAKKRTELVQKIAQEVRVHARIEEEIFYPAYRAAAKIKEDLKLFFEATEEHGLVDVVLPELEDAEPTTDVFSAKGKVLKDLIEHHAEEEEEQMFPRARKLLGKDRLVELGAELEARKAELMEELRG